MSVKQNLAWLLLLVRLPATHSAERVAIWRKLKKSGAIQVQTSTYILPDDPPRYETFQWLTQQIRDAGGDATLIRAREIEGFSNDRLSSCSTPPGLRNTGRFGKRFARLLQIQGEHQIVAANLAASESNFAKSEGQIFLIAPKRKMWRWSC